MAREFIGTLDVRVLVLSPSPFGNAPKGIIAR